MPYEITNSVRSSSIIRVEGAGTTNVSLANLSTSAAETVNSANIKRVTWSTNGSISITRNSVPLLTLFGNGEMRLSEYGHVIANNNTQTISIVVTGAGSVVMEVTKEATYSPALNGI
jgi:hypothetical protein